MSPLALIFLIIGLPSVAGLIYIFVRGSAGLRRYILTRIGLLIPMVFILASLVFFVMSVAAAEAAVGLAIVIALFRNKQTVNIDEIRLFRG